MGRAPNIPPHKKGHPYLLPKRKGAYKPTGLRAIK